MENNRLSPRHLKPVKKATGLLLTLLLTVTSIIASAQRLGDGELKNKNVNAAIISLNALSETQHNTVRWITRSACIEGTYLVERSTDGETFEIIGLRRGVSTGPNNNMEYFFVDREPPQGEQVFYRVRHFGNDNSEMLSKSVVTKQL